MVISAADLSALADAAASAAKAGVQDLLLEPPGKNLPELHQNLSLIRRGALDRAHPGLAYPTFLRVEAGEFEKATLGITKFASVLSLAGDGGETWLPLWTLRQNIYTDPQKPLQMDPGVYPMGEPDARSPLLVTTNFSLTYFIVSTELDGAGLPSHLAVVDTEGMSVLTAWSAGKFSGERVAKALKEMAATERVGHKTVIIPATPRSFRPSSRIRSARAGASSPAAGGLRHRPVLPGRVGRRWGASACVGPALPRLRHVPLVEILPLPMVVQESSLKVRRTTPGGFRVLGFGRTRPISWPMPATVGACSTWRGRLRRSRCASGRAEGARGRVACERRPRAAQRGRPSPREPRATSRKSGSG